MFIQFAPTSGCLGSIVSVVTDFCRHVVDDPDIQYAFQMAAYELTENLVKYSTRGLASSRIEVENTACGPEINLLVQQSIERPNESRLGLGRLRAEGDRVLAHPITQNGLIVQARRLARRPMEELDS